jgi:hypothetical protein
MAIIVDNPNFPEFFPFKGGEIRVDLVDFLGTHCTRWTVSKGSFRCADVDCKKSVNVGGEVNPVFWKKQPSNFVCCYCRGLLIPIDNSQT